MDEVQVPNERASTERPGGSRQISGRLLVACGLIIAVVAGGVGAVAGWKIEQQRVKDDLVNIRPIGTVTGVTDDSITINVQSSSRTFLIGQDTSIDVALAADISEASPGARVLVRSERNADGDLEATQIVVLSSSAESQGDDGS